MKAGTLAEVDAARRMPKSDTQLRETLSPEKWKETLERREELRKTHPEIVEFIEFIKSHFPNANPSRIKVGAHHE